MKQSNRIDEARTLNPGLLRHQITWERQIALSSPLNTFGEDQFEWTGILTCRAQVRELTGRELESAQQRWAEAKYAIRQYYTPGLELTDRIYWFVDGTVKYLDLLEIADQAGTGFVQDIIAKEWTP